MAVISDPIACLVPDDLGGIRYQLKFMCNCSKSTQLDLNFHHVPKSSCMVCLYWILYSIYHACVLYLSYVLEVLDRIALLSFLLNPLMCWSQQLHQKLINSISICYIMYHLFKFFEIILFFPKVDKLDISIWKYNDFYYRLKL